MITVESKLVTAGGKEFQLRPVVETGMYTIEFTTGGQVPDELKGSFTSIGKAELAIKVYMERKPKAKSTTKKVANG